MKTDANGGWVAAKISIYIAKLLKLDIVLTLDSKVRETLGARRLVLCIAEILSCGCVISASTLVIINQALSYKVSQ